MRCRYLAARPPLSRGRENERMARVDEMKMVLIIVGVILVAAAISGGVLVSNLLWFLLILALVVFAIGVYTGRITE